MMSMKKRLVLYAAVAVALALLGYIIAERLTDDAEPRGASGERPVAVPAARQQPQKPSGNTDVGGGHTAVEARQVGVRVVEVTGNATRSSATGEVSPLTPGLDLAVDDSLRTEASSRVRLKIGDSSTVDLADRAEVQVRELSDSIQRLGLVYGRAVVDYREDGGRVLKIENRDGSAVAQVKAGKFSILNTGTTVAVATETGQVDLTAGGNTVRVGAAQQSIVTGGAPSRPLAIPVDLALRVVDPGCRVQKEAFYTVSGRTTPGAKVTVNEMAARVDEKGDFSLRLPLKIGKNKIVVVSEDVSGREEKRVFPCITVDPGAPIKGVDIKWGGGATEGGG